MTTETLDPMAAAMDAKPLPSTNTYFGEVTIVDVWFCVLQKGVGKVQFDPGQHRGDQRRIAIDLAIAPLQGSYTIDQKCIETSKEWLKVTLPSLQAHGANLSTLLGRFCQLRREPTGETYTNKHGEIKEKSALKFIAFYDDRDACEAASEAFWTERNAAADNGEIPGAVKLADVPEPPSSNGNGAETETDEDKLRTLWAAAEKDATTFATLLAANPLGKKFKITSRAVKAIMTEDGEIPW